MAINITNKIKSKVLLNGYHRMTLDFGYTYRDGSFHKGIDLTGNPDVNNGYDSVVAIDGGTVTAACNTYSKTGKVGGTGDMGNYVIIDHGNGYKTRYMHMAKGSVKVVKGQTVKAGQVIGYIGNTGNSTGRHLHFDVSHNGTYIDPKPYLYGQKKFQSGSDFSKGTYVVVGAVNVRQGPGVNYHLKTFSQFTTNAQAQVKKIDSSCPNHFPVGVRVTISEVDGTWGKCPSGWISLKYCRRVK